MSFFRDFLRYSRGGGPVPQALDAQAEFLSSREELPSEGWVAEALGSVNVRPEIAGYAYEFFASFNIPIGKIRCSDRLKDDLHFKEALQDDWDLELNDDFKQRFKGNLGGWPHIETVGDLLLFLDRAQDG
jgi:hypothetical protein